MKKYALGLLRSITFTSEQLFGIGVFLVVVAFITVMDLLVIMIS